MRRTTSGPPLAVPGSWTRAWRCSRPAWSSRCGTTCEEHAARAFCNLASICVSNHALDRARRYLRSGQRLLRRARPRYLAAEHRERGRRRGTRRRAVGRQHWARCAEILRNRRGSAVIRVTALWVLGVIEVRRGLPDAQAHLDEAQALAARMQDPQSLVPVAAGPRRGRLDGRQNRRGADGDRPRLRAGRAVRPTPGGWVKSAWWSMLSGPPRDVPRTTEPHDLMLDGQWRAGADAWERHGNPFWRALCLAQSDDPGDARAAHALLTVARRHRDTVRRAT